MHLCKFIFHIHIHSSVVPVLLPEFLTFFIPTTKALNADHVTVHFILTILVSLCRFRFVAVLSSLVMSCFIWFYLYWLKTCFPKWLQQNGFVRRKNWAVVFTFCLILYLIWPFQIFFFFSSVNSFQWNTNLYKWRYQIGHTFYAS